MTSPIERITNPKTSQRLLGLASRIVAEPDIHRLCELILEEAQNITGAEGGTLYLTSQDQDGMDHQLRFVIVKNTALDLNTEANLPPVELFQPDQAATPNLNSIAAATYHKGTVLRIDDAYQTDEYDFSGTRAFDAATGYRSVSFLTVPLKTDGGTVVGVFQLINATHPSSGEVCRFDDDQQIAVEVLAEFAAKALEQQLINQRQQELMVELSGQSNTSALTEQILREAKKITHADGGTLYLLRENGDGASLEFSLVLNDSLNISLGGRSGDPVNLPSIPLHHASGHENRENVASYVALTGETVVIDDAYAEPRFDLSGTQNFDKSTGYHSKSFLTVPLKNHENEVIGVLQLLNAKHTQTGEIIGFSERWVIIVEALSRYAAIALHNRILVGDLKNLLDAFIKAIARAIDAKSAHTSAHCERVPMLMELIAQAACDDDAEFKDFQLNDDEWYELQVSAWMHDCGKLATPDSVLDKSTKLHLMRDGIEEVVTRLAVVAANVDPHSELYANLSEAETFLRRANRGGEFMSDDDKARVRELSQLRWTSIDGQEHNLLSEEEVAYLCIERGTLSHEEREIINNHMVVTIDILESLPFPKKLRNVPEYAGGHHEKMDGTGFPRQLTRDQMSIPARMMAIADIFEALTSRDRPYKDPMKLSTALSIMKNMKRNNHIDPDLFDLFLRAKVWQKYADQALLEEQKDIQDASAYLE